MATTKTPQRPRPAARAAGVTLPAFVRRVGSGAARTALTVLGALAVLLLAGAGARASEGGGLAIPDLHAGRFFTTPGDPNSGISAWWFLFWGAWVIVGTLSISLFLRHQI